VINDNLIPLGLDSRLVANLSCRIEEAERCEAAAAYLAATVLYGSILEGVLEGLANKEPKTANSSPAAPKGDDGRPKRFSDWKFKEWIAVARNVDWIPSSVGAYVDQLRGYRNLIHFSQQLREGLTADKHLAKVTRSVLDAVLQHISDASNSGSQ
jgi:hypothetical protein